MKPNTHHPRVMLMRAAIILIFGLPAFAGDLKIIANPSVKTDSVSIIELRDVFLAERTSLRDGSHVEPVFERRGAVHEIFLRDFLKESNEFLQNHYGSLVFTGKASMPKFFNSDAEVVAYVARTRGAIGYVSVSTSTTGVKTVDVIFDYAKSSRTLLTRIEPEYPETLRHLGIGGTVRLQLTVSPEGRVESVTLLGGNPILGESAIAAVKQWVYTASASHNTLEVSIPFEAPH